MPFPQGSNTSSNASTKPEKPLLMTRKQLSDPFGFVDDADDDNANIISPSRWVIWLYNMGDLDMTWSFESIYRFQVMGIPGFWSCMLRFVFDEIEESYL